MIKAVIFDCFGVLTTDGWHPFKYTYFKDNQELNDEAGQTMDLANRGKITHLQLFSMLGEIAGISAESVEKQLTTNQANIELFHYIRDNLKPKYKTGLLSNVSRNRLNDLFSQEQLNLLDEVTLSYEIGAIKPDKKAYTIAAERLECAPQECVFIDDSEYFVAGAVDSGMKAIYYLNFAQMKQELEQILKMSDSDK